MCEAQGGIIKHESEEFSQTKTYLNEYVGINADMLLSRSLLMASVSLAYGELGFFGAYLPAGEVRLSSAKGERLGTLEISVNRGEFRFDGEFNEVDEFVAIVAADTITMSPKTQSTLLGLVTRDGISRRVGIGFVYYSKDPSSLKPRWQYKFFRLR